MSPRLLKLGLRLISLVTFAYSLVVLLMGFQGFFPRACSFNVVCGLLNMPTEMIGVLILVGVNCAIVGNLWWAIGWAAGEIAKTDNSPTQMEFLHVAATRIRWVFWTATGAMLALPLYFIVAWLAVVVVGWLIFIPILLGRLLS